MKFTRYGRAAVIAVAGAIVLSSCAANEEAAPAPSEGTEPSALSGDLVGIGASSQGSAQESWVAGFQTANPDVNISYDPAGSGGGRDAFVAGSADFIGTDRAFKDEEIAAGEFGACADAKIVELPLYISPIAVIFNLEGVDALNMDAATIAGIFTGAITNWNDPAIAEANPDATLPDLAITAVHRSDDSGTTENFTDYLFQVAPDVWTIEPDGVFPEALGGEAAKGTSGVVDAVTNGTGTIGYADASKAGDLGTVSVKVGEEFVEYSPEAAAAIVDASPLVEGRGANDLAIELNRTSEEAGIYPIVLVSYLVACETYAESDNVELIKAYFTYIASEEGQKVAAEAAGSAPISSALFEKIQPAIDAIK